MKGEVVGFRRRSPIAMCLGLLAGLILGAGIMTWGARRADVNRHGKAARSIRSLRRPSGHEAFRRWICVRGEAGASRGG